MKRYLLIIMISLLAGEFWLVQGDNQQPCVQSVTNMPRSRDVVKKVEIQPFKMSQRGVNQVWDFSQFTILKKKGEAMYRQTNDSTLVANENSENQTFFLRNDSLLLLKQGAPGKDVTYSRMELTIKYPMSFGDSIGGYFYGDGSLGNFSYLRNAGRSSSVISGIGTMITPEGDTLRNVLRHDYFRIGTTFILPHFKQSFAKSKDSALLSTDSIARWIATDSITHKIERTSWYAPGYRYPIIENRKYTIYYYRQPIDSVKIAYYTSPQSQELTLENDPENEEIRYAIEQGEFNNRFTPSRSGYNNAAHSSRPKNSNNTPSIPQGNDEVVSGLSTGNATQCVIYPQTIEQSTKVTFTGGAGMSMSIEVYNTAGALVWRTKGEITDPVTSHTCTLNTLAAGEYLLVAKVGTDIFPFKIIKR